MPRKTWLHTFNMHAYDYVHSMPHMLYVYMEEAVNILKMHVKVAPFLTASLNKYSIILCLFSGHPPNRDITCISKIY